MKNVQVFPRFPHLLFTPLFPLSSAASFNKVLFLPADNSLLPAFSIVFILTFFFCFASEYIRLQGVCHQKCAKGQLRKAAAAYISEYIDIDPRDIRRALQKVDVDWI